MHSNSRGRGLVFMFTVDKLEILVVDLDQLILQAEVMPQLADFLVGPGEVFLEALRSGSELFVLGQEGLANPSSKLQVSLFLRWQVQIQSLFIFLKISKR